MKVSCTNVDIYRSCALGVLFNSRGHRHDPGRSILTFRIGEGKEKIIRLLPVRIRPRTPAVDAPTVDSACYDANLWARQYLVEIRKSIGLVSIGVNVGERSLFCDQIIQSRFSLRLKLPFVKRFDELVEAVLQPIRVGGVGWAGMELSYPLFSTRS
jgi:hypothetical protein